ncbi:17754_t:CDS:1, partial [Racocetra fulgida]
MYQITIYWYNNTLSKFFIELHRILLNNILFDKSHTANLIIKILKEIDIGRKLLGITTDNIANMCFIENILQEKVLSKFNNNSIQHFYYSIHILNLDIEEGIKKVNKKNLE